MSDEEQQDLNKTGKTDNKGASGKNPNPAWQKKFGRTSCENNIYGIYDIQNSDCGISYGI